MLKAQWGFGLEVPAWGFQVLAAPGFKAWRVFLEFRGLGVQGFRGLGCRGLGFRGLGFSIGF